MISPATVWMANATASTPDRRGPAAGRLVEHADQQRTERREHVADALRERGQRHRSLGRAGAQPDRDEDHRERRPARSPSRVDPEPAAPPCGATARPTYAHGRARGQHQDQRPSRRIRPATVGISSAIGTPNAVTPASSSPAVDGLSSPRPGTAAAASPSRRTRRATACRSTPPSPNRAGCAPAGPGRPRATRPPGDPRARGRSAAGSHGSTATAASTRPHAEPGPPRAERVRDRHRGGRRDRRRRPSTPSCTPR